MSTMDVDGQVQGLQAGVLVAGACIANWIGSWIDFEELGEWELSPVLTKVIDLLEETSPDFAIYKLRDRRARFGFPSWTKSLGGFKDAYLYIVVATICNLLIHVYLLGPNYFQIVGVHPSYTKSPTFGLELKRALMDDTRGVIPEGMTEADIKVVYQTLVDGNSRMAYDIYGTTEVRLRTIPDLLFTLRFPLIFYICLTAFYGFLCSTSYRLSSASSSGMIVIGVVLFLDFSALLGLSSPRDLTLLMSLPHFSWLTTHQLLWIFRTFVTPPLLVACLFYSSHKYVDYDEYGLEETMKLLEETVLTNRHITECINHCQERRKIMEETGSLPKRRHYVQPKEQEQEQEQDQDQDQERQESTNNVRKRNNKKKR